MEVKKTAKAKGNKSLKKLQLKKDTIKILKDVDLKNIAGGLPRWTLTLCGTCE